MMYLQKGLRRKKHDVKRKYVVLKNEHVRKSGQTGQCLTMIRTPRPVRETDTKASVFSA
jgi:hypothetical protein